jgi:Domain of unknown function (DUF397)
MDLLDARWRKSSYSGAGNECVEVAVNLDAVVAVRDSKDPAGPALVFDAHEFRTFIGRTKAGELGHA